MTDRKIKAQRFLDRTVWVHAQVEPLAGDASNRRYDRLADRDTGKTAVLMDAPPEKGEDVRPFVRVARFLGGIGLSAPEILAEDTENGFLVLEDLGDDLFARVIPNAPESEFELYGTATDVLIHLHKAGPPDLKPYDPPLMTELAALAFSKYRDGILGQPDPDTQRRFQDLFKPLLERVTAAADPVLIQRDYHAENLLWLPQREGIARVGLLDFQDAMLGHPAYDLVSLLQDARRDVPLEIEAAMVDRFVESTERDPEAFRAAYAVLGAQRNLRILGVFARLGMDYGKPHYVDLIPRVWQLLQRDLAHPALGPTADFLRDTLPEPTRAHLDRLKAK